MFYWDTKYKQVVDAVSFKSKSEVDPAEIKQILDDTHHKWYFQENSDVVQDATVFCTLTQKKIKGQGFGQKDAAATRKTIEGYETFLKASRWERKSTEQLYTYMMMTFFILFFLLGRYPGKIYFYYQLAVKLSIVSARVYLFSKPRENFWCLDWCYFIIPLTDLVPILFRDSDMMLKVGFLCTFP